MARPRNQLNDVNKYRLQTTLTAMRQTLIDNPPAMADLVKDLVAKLGFVVSKGNVVGACEVVGIDYPPKRARADLFDQDPDVPPRVDFLMRSQGQLWNNMMFLARELGVTLPIPLPPAPPDDHVTV